jgi:hypothetical protein
MHVYRILWFVRNEAQREIIFQLEAEAKPRLLIEYYYKPQQVV